MEGGTGGTLQHCVFSIACSTGNAKVGDCPTWRHEGVAENQDLSSGVCSAANRSVEFGLASEEQCQHGEDATEGGLAHADDAVPCEVNPKP